MTNLSVVSSLRQNGLKEIQEQLNLPRTIDDIELVRFAARENFIAFCVAMMPNFLSTKFHQLLADELQQMYENVRDGKDMRTILETPPQIGKSTVSSVLFPAWVLGKEKWPVICASYGAALAERKSQECRDIIESDIYQYIFPHTRLHPDSQSKEFWRTTSGGSYRAVGVGGALTGMSGKILIVDDPIKDRADADSGVIREGTWKWFTSVLYTRKQSKSGFLLVQTRWHLDDVAGRLIEQQESHKVNETEGHLYDQWERLRFPAFAEEDEYFNGKLFRKAGEVLCPERFTEEDMLKTKNQLDVYDWSSLYMQSPILSENQEFKSEWFKYFDEREIAGKRFDIYVLVDLAISQKKSADNTSIQVLGKERNSPDIYHLEEKTGRFDPGTTVEHLFHLKNKYTQNKFVVGLETVAFQKSMMYSVMEEQKKREVYFDIHEIKSSQTSKEDRIRGLIPLYKTGVIYHRKGVDNDLERELLQFPKGKHDDRIDALAFFLQVAKPTSYKTNQPKRYVPKATTYLPRTLGS